MCIKIILILILLLILLIIIRAQSLLYWPGIIKDINKVRAECSCCINVPFQSPAAPNIPDIPSTPFEYMCADFFDVSNHHYIIAGDRLPGWVKVFSSSSGTSKSRAVGLISHLRSFFVTFGVPEQLSRDTVQNLLHHLPRSSLSTGVFTIGYRLPIFLSPMVGLKWQSKKHFLFDCVGPAGSLNSDKFLQGMLHIRNTPNPDCKLSPAQIIFARPLRDAFSFINRVAKFQNSAINLVWREAWNPRETSLCTRFSKSVENLDLRGHEYSKLAIGDRAFVQNQSGPHPNKWDRSGTIVDVKEHHQYIIKLDGSGRLSLRNHRFLHQYTLPSLSFKHPSYEMDLAVTPCQMPVSMSDEIKPTTNVGVPQNKHDHFLASYPSPPGHTTEGTSEANFPMRSPTDTIDDNDCDSLPNSPFKTFGVASSWSICIA